MKKQRGFAIYAIVAAVIAFGGLGLFAWKEYYRAETAEANLIAYGAGVEFQGELAKKEAEKQNFWNSENVRIANERLAETNNRDDDRIKRMRDETNSSSWRVSETARIARELKVMYQINTATYRRRSGAVIAGYEKRYKEQYSDYERRLRSIADRCRANQRNIDNACEWGAGIERLRVLNILNNGNSSGD